MITATAIVAVLGPKYRVDADGDIEKFCVRCARLFGEEHAWWPADSEFFTRDAGNGRGQLHSWCRACNLENRFGDRLNGVPPEPPPTREERLAERRQHQEERGQRNIEIGRAARFGDAARHAPPDVAAERAEERRHRNVEIGHRALAFDNWRRPDSKLSGGTSLRFARRPE